MADPSTFDGFKDWLLGILFAAVAGLAGLIRRLDVGEITRRLDRLEGQMDRLEGKTTAEGDAGRDRAAHHTRRPQ